MESGRDRTLRTLLPTLVVLLLLGFGLVLPFLARGGSEVEVDGSGPAPTPFEYRSDNETDEGTVIAAPEVLSEQVEAGNGPLDGLFDDVVIDLEPISDIRTDPPAVTATESPTPTTAATTVPATVVVAPTPVPGTPVPATPVPATPVPPTPLPPTPLPPTPVPPTANPTATAVPPTPVPPTPTAVPPTPTAVPPTPVPPTPVPPTPVPPTPVPPTPVPPTPVPPRVGLTAPGCPGGYTTVATQPPNTSFNGVSVCVLFAVDTFNNQNPPAQRISRACTGSAPANTAAWYYTLDGGSLDCGYWVTANGQHGI